MKLKRLLRELGMTRNQSLLDEIEGFYPPDWGTDQQFQKCYQKYLDDYKKTDDAVNHQNNRRFWMYRLSALTACLILTLVLIPAFKNKQHKIEARPPQKTTETMAVSSSTTVTESINTVSRTDALYVTDTYHMETENIKMTAVETASQSITSIVSSKASTQAIQSTNNIAAATSIQQDTPVTTTGTASVTTIISGNAVIHREQQQIEVTSICFYPAHETQTTAALKDTEEPPVTTAVSETVSYTETDAAETETETEVISSTEEQHFYIMNDCVICIAQSGISSEEPMNLGLLVSDKEKRERLAELVEQFPDASFEVQIRCYDKYHHFRQLSGEILEEAHRLSESGIPIGLNPYQRDIYAILTADQILHFPGTENLEYEFMLSYFNDAVSLLPVIGDINFDGYINKFDLSYMEDYLDKNSSLSFTTLQYMCADCNCDGIVDEEDLSFLQDMLYK